MALRRLKRGQVVLVRYPFTDLTTAKVRPAVILSPEPFLSRGDDIVLLFISSIIPPDPLPSDLVLTPEDPAFAATGLKYPSVFRGHKITVLHKSLVQRVLGVLNDELLARLDACLMIALGL
ncbi:MAG: type II toxin-antitoxin system PemK/MazF family toxin [Thermodesulfobacteriota bacterium]